MFGKFFVKLRKNFEEISNKCIVNFLKHLGEILEKFTLKCSKNCEERNLLKKFVKFYKNISFWIVGNFLKKFVEI